MGAERLLWGLIIGSVLWLAMQVAWFMVTERIEDGQHDKLMREFRK